MSSNYGYLRCQTKHIEVSPNVHVLGPLGSFVEFDQSGQTSLVEGFPMMQGRAVSRTALPSPLWMVAAAISTFPPSISVKTRRTAAFIPTSSFQSGRTARQSCSVTGAWVQSRGQPQKRLQDYLVDSQDAIG